jgi:chromate transporter
VKDPPKPTPLALAIAFMQIGLTSVGGAASPLRYVLVISRRWFSETEYSEVFGIAQALPGATAANLAIIIADRFAGPAGAAAALAGLVLPSLVVALSLLFVATHLSASQPRFLAAELAVTASIGGLFMANGLRLAWHVWRAPDARPRSGRLFRLAIMLAGIVSIAQFHLMVPIAVVVLGAASYVVEWTHRS